MVRLHAQFAASPPRCVMVGTLLSGLCQPGLQGLKLYFLFSYLFLLSPSLAKKKSKQWEQRFFFVTLRNLWNLVLVRNRRKMDAMPGSIYLWIAHARTLLVHERRECNEKLTRSAQLGARQGGGTMVVVSNERSNCLDTNYNRGGLIVLN